MNIDELKDLQNRLRYKGNLCIQVSFWEKHPMKPLPLGMFYLMIWIHANEVDTGKPTQIGMGSIWTFESLADHDLDAILTNVRDTLQLLEIHECNEQFKLDGGQVFDPHVVFGKRIDLKQEEMPEERKAA